MGYSNGPDMLIMTDMSLKPISICQNKLEQSVHCFEPDWDSIWATNGTQIGTLLQFSKPLTNCFYYIFRITRSTSPAPFFLNISIISSDFCEWAQFAHSRLEAIWKQSIQVEFIVENKKTVPDQGIDNIEACLL